MTTSAATLFADNGKVCWHTRHMASGSARKRAAREAGLDSLREVWADRDFGVSLAQSRGGQLRLTWIIDSHEEVVLMSLDTVRRFVDEVEREHVLALRAVGVSWADLGYFLGMTGEAARRRHSALQHELEALEDGDTP